LEAERHITVVGSGIIGLSTAVLLQQSGFRVRILSHAHPMQTTSSKAAAIWFPYEAEPIEKVNTWSGISFRQYEAQMKFESTGISLISILILAKPDTNTSWIQQLPAASIRAARRDELPRGFVLGYVVTVPLIPPPQYLIYLLGQFREMGGVYEEGRITSLQELSQADDLVVNCTGLGAREICQDTQLYPIRGQLLRTSRLDVPSIIDATTPGSLSYAMQRADCTILGGTHQPENWSEMPTDEDTRGILTRLKELGVLDAEPEITAQVVGLRPRRDTIRCEWDDTYTNVFHNYGHGGAGFTVAWGCAEETVRQLQAYARPVAGIEY